MTMAMESGLARHVATCHRHDPSGFRPFLVTEGERPLPVGRVRHDLARSLQGAPGIIVDRQSVCLDPRIRGFKARSEAMEAVVHWLFRKGLIARIREEIFPVASDWDSAPLFQMDRGAVVALGIAARKAQLNGYVARDNPADVEAIWLAQRSWMATTAPGKFDTLAVGGQAIGLSAKEAMIQEGWEEAGIPATLARKAQRVHRLHYLMDVPDGTRWEQLTVYDLALPEAFVPDNKDGEIIAFRRCDPGALVAELRDHDTIKYNSALVLLDFLLRHRILGKASGFDPAREKREIRELKEALLRHHGRGPWDENGIMQQSA